MSYTKNAKTIQKDYAISFLRAMSLMLVICCHLLEWIGVHTDGTKGAFIDMIGNYCSVGVQIFLLISGYLYGKKANLFPDSISRVDFIKKNFWKLLKDYYLSYIILTIPLCIFLRPEALTPAALFGALTTWCTFGGQNQLWFIPYILFCYLLTPFLYDIRKWVAQKNTLIRFIVLLLLVEVMFLEFKFYFVPAWISCYIMGFFLPGMLDKMINRINYILLVLLCIATNALKIYLRYRKGILTNSLSGIKAVILGEFYNWTQVLLAVVLFVGIYMVLSRLFAYKQKIGWLEIADKYSYDMYLVHQLFVKGMLSTVFLTNYMVINVVLTFLLILICGVLLYYVARPNLIFKSLRN